jgi:hypothetical protein
MGVTFPDGVIWPEERTSWTAAAVLLAHDALHDITPAGRLFSHSFWNGNGIPRECKRISFGASDRRNPSAFHTIRG